MAQIRRYCPRTRIVIRGDSGFCRDEIMSWCECNGVDYMLGLFADRTSSAVAAGQSAAAVHCLLRLCADAWIAPPGAGRHRLRQGPVHHDPVEVAEVRRLREDQRAQGLVVVLAVLRLRGRVRTSSDQPAYAFPKLRIQIGATLIESDVHRVDNKSRSSGIHLHCSLGGTLVWNGPIVRRVIARLSNGCEVLLGLVADKPSLLQARDSIFLPLSLKLVTLRLVWRVDSVD